MASDFVDAVRASSGRLGISPSDLLTAISFETGGTMSPSLRGGEKDASGRPTMLGLIQFNPDNQRKYGVNPGQSQAEQMGAVENYLRDRGVKPGMGMLDVYSAINAGRPGLYDRSDTARGGTPGTVADKVATQMVGHRARANAMLGDGDPDSVPSPSYSAAPTNTEPGSASAPVPSSTSPAGATAGAPATDAETDAPGVSQTIGKLISQQQAPRPVQIDLPQPVGLPAAQKLAAIMQRLQVANGS